jgi:ABC-type transporter Mla MlaB component
MIEWLDRGVLSLRGPLTLETRSSFQNAVRREDAATMILDLTGVPYIDSSGLGSLVSTHVSCAKSGRRIVAEWAERPYLEIVGDNKARIAFSDFSHGRGRNKKSHGCWESIVRSHRC